MPTSLQRQLVLLLVVASALIGSQFASDLPWHTGLSPVGVGLALAAWAWHWQVVWRNAALNRKDDTAPIRGSLGLPNWMSIVRGFLNSVLVGFVLVSAENIWLPAILYSVSALLDVFDGLAARLTKQTSQLGALLDMEYDSVGLVIVIALALSMGQLPPWFVLIAVARYLFVLGLRWRERRGLPAFELTESHNRRAAAGLMMAYLTVILWPIVDARSANVAAYVFGFPFLAGFLRDWLVVSGMIDPQDAHYQTFHQWAKRLTEFAAPQAARLVALGVILSGWVALDFSTVPGWFGVFGVLSIGLGVLARVGTVFLVVLAVLGAGGGEGANLILVACALYILIYGLRRYSLWVPEERIFSGRLG